MPPPTLNEHVLAEILSYCDIYHVVKMTQVDKRCRSAALAKQLWISLIRDLEFRGLRDVDPLEQLEDCTTEDLIVKVKRVASGPRTWLPSSPTPPKLEREVLVTLGPQTYETGTILEVLPGGKHFLLRRLPHGSIYEIWAVSSQSRIWSRQPKPSELSEIEVMEGGEKAVVMFGGSTNLPLLEFIEVDLRTGDSFVSFETPIPGQIDVATAARFQLVGEHLVFSLVTKTLSEVHVVNWANATYVLLQFPRMESIACSLMPGYVSVLHFNADPDRRLFSSVYALDSLDWKPIASWAQMLPDTPSPISSVMLPIAEVNLITSLQLVGRVSPFQRGAYRFAVHVVTEKPAASGIISRLWQTLFATRDEQRIHYSLVFVPPSLEMVPLHFNSALPRPMYGVAAGRGMIIVLDGSNEMRPVIHYDQVLSNTPLPQLGTHSAALPLVKDNVLRIMYFE
ncbi:hypothetical protein FB45DRAFT_1063457 [Roridomyces roridus]|uniref:F-box domain-containing protein n=1 Tax=Roridomyces roridus TaxID=1738132 RepID=A0AAD7BE62_9AGAR|nr:hypothetical protein FB45DRAFT_1063457 [Roridomyces roridus]